MHNVKWMSKLSPIGLPECQKGTCQKSQGQPPFCLLACNLAVPLFVTSAGREHASNCFEHHCVLVSMTHLVIKLTHVCLALRLWLTPPTPLHGVALSRAGCRPPLPEPGAAVGWQADGRERGTVPGADCPPSRDQGQHCEFTTSMPTVTTTQAHI